MLCYSQSSVEVSDPRLEVRDNKLVITYDILKGDPGEKYVISIDIRDEQGNTIRANTLKGDVGMVEEGGVGKRIVWDPAADNIFINSQIYVKVNAEIILPPEPEEPPEPVDLSKTVSPADHVEAKEFSRTGLVLQSLAIPGLGLSRLTGNPHWIRGVAGYGCLAGSVTMNRVALNNYGDIGGLEEYEEKNELYDKAALQNNIASVLAFTAAAIWVTDIIWTLVGTSELKRGSQSAQSKGVSIHGKIDPLSGTPLLSLNYNF